MNKDNLMIKCKSMIVLSMVLMLILPQNIYAYTSEQGDNRLKDNYSKTVEVEYEGQVYDVEVSSNLPLGSEDDIMPCDMYPRHKVGSKRTVNFKISRDQLAFASSGAEISIRVINGIASEVIKKAIPGIGYISIALFAGASAMYIVGVNGLDVTVDLEYGEYFNHKEGYKTYYWFITDLDIRGY